MTTSTTDQQQQVEVPMDLGSDYLSLVASPACRRGWLQSAEPARMVPRCLATEPCTWGEQ